MTTPEPEIVVDVLRRAEEILTERGWGRDSWALGGPEDEPTCFCLGGALAYAASRGRVTAPVRLSLSEHRLFEAAVDRLGFRSYSSKETALDVLISWNDYYAKDAVEVLTRLRLGMAGEVQ